MTDELTESAEPSDAAQADVELLLNAAMEYAQNALEQRGLLIPVGIGLDNEPDADGDDQISVFEPDPEPEGEEQAQEALEGLEEHLRAGRNAFRAAALAFDVDGEDDWDLITVLIAHNDGTTVDVQIPYRIVDEEIEIGEPETYAGTLAIWES